MNDFNSGKKRSPVAIADVQGRPDSRRMPINKVGIKDIFHPVRVRDRTGNDQHTIASFNMYVALPHDFKGTHMSRFVEVLHAHEREISVESFRQMLGEMTQRLDATSGHIEMDFPYFVLKSAPVSGVQSLMNYSARLIGEIHDGQIDAWVRVVVPVTSLCPCSKDISEGGAHNQRSHITITARASAHLWIEELIDIAEQEASCEVFGMLKRPDEKHVTERAYDNPKFVEDIVRDVAGRLEREERVRAYVVEAENFESIHNHSAYALIERDKDAPGALLRTSGSVDRALFEVEIAACQVVMVPGCQRDDLRAEPREIVGRIAIDHTLEVAHQDRNPPAGLRVAERLPPHVGGDGARLHDKGSYAIGLRLRVHVLGQADHRCLGDTIRGQIRCDDDSAFRGDIDDAARTTRPHSGQHRTHEEQGRSEEHTSELQSQSNLVCRL